MMTMSKIGDLTGYRTVWTYEDGIAKILSLNNFMITFVPPVKCQRCTKFKKISLVQVKEVDQTIAGITLSSRSLKNKLNMSHTHLHFWSKKIFTIKCGNCLDRFSESLHKSLSWLISA